MDEHPGCEGQSGWGRHLVIELNLPRHEASIRLASIESNLWQRFAIDGISGVLSLAGVLRDSDFGHRLFVDFVKNLWGSSFSVLSFIPERLRLAK